MENKALKLKYLGYNIQQKGKDDFRNGKNIVSRI